MDLKVFLLLLIFSIAIAEYKSYAGYKVYKIIPQSDREIQILIDLEKNNEYIFWTDTIKLESDVRIMVDPGKQKEFEAYFDKVDIKPKVVIPDVQKLIDDQLKPSKNANRNVRDYRFERYLGLEEIYEWLDDIIQTHSDVATPVTIGVTEEGRDIKGVIIDYKKRENPTIGMIEGGIHAREWIAPATVTWIIKEFLTSTDPEVRALAENIVWHIFPVVNPDGYVYTFTNNRLWRKNRNTANHTSCSQWNLSDDMSNGIDLNRNFGFLWMSIGASQNPCAETFAGPVASSERETIAIVNYVTALKQQGNVVYYFAFHSFSQMVLVPYSHVGGVNVLEAPNYGDMYEIAIRGAKKLEERHGTVYLVGTSVDILYAVSGSSFDWARGSADIPIVYLFELRDIGEYGFLLPPELIIPNNEEIMAALVEMDKTTRHLGYYVRSSGFVSKLNLFLFISLFLFL